MSGVFGTYFERHAQTFVGSLGRMTRQPFGTLMTIAVIGIALALPASLELLLANARAATGSWDNALDISVYLEPGVGTPKAEQLAKALGQRRDVAAVRVIPPEEALRQFRKYSGFGTALDALTDNPLPNTLVVTPRADHSTPVGIDSLKRYLKNWPEVELVQIDTEWVNRFHSILEVARRIVLLVGVLLAAGVIVIVGNTIRLDIDNRRAEIEVTKLVGGSNAFVRRPFLYSGFWYGLAGGALAWGLVSVGVWLLSDPINRLAGLYGSGFRLIGVDPRTAVLLLGGGTVLGWLGSWIATARHLRSIEPA